MKYYWGWFHNTIVRMAGGLLVLMLCAGSAWTGETAAPNYAELFERLQLLPHEERVEAPDFSLPDMDGNTLTLSDLRGKAVFLNFWTTW